MNNINNIYHIGKLVFNFIYNGYLIICTPLGLNNQHSTVYYYKLGDLGRSNNSYKQHFKN